MGKGGGGEADKNRKTQDAEYRGFYGLNKIVWIKQYRKIESNVL